MPRPHCGSAAPHGEHEWIEGAALRRECLGTGPERRWIERTWEDARTGDRVRQPGTEVTAEVFSTVQGVKTSAGEWHVIAGASAKGWDDRPAAWRWCRVRFAADPDTLRELNPDAPVEILMSREELRVADLLGWENRLSVSS